jgi:hypothetical protein
MDDANDYRSAIINHLNNTLKRSESGLAFIYCNYNERESQSVEYFAGMIARQLIESRALAIYDAKFGNSVPIVPIEIEKVYDRHFQNQTKPDLAGYLEILTSLSSTFYEIYIVIDALDECLNENEEPIWGDLILNLKVAFPALRLICTSRDTTDYYGHLFGSTEVELRGDQEDMRNYASYEIESKTNLYWICQQDANIFDEILAVVISRADGA